MAAQNDTWARLKEHKDLFAKLGIPANKLKKKYIVGQASSRFTRGGAGSANRRGQHGRAARRWGGWKKHGKGPQNRPR